MRSLILTGLALGAFALPLNAEKELRFDAPVLITEEAVTVPGGADPGESASKGKLVYLTKTPNGVHDGRLVTVYSDANNIGPVWHPKSGEHLARDIFVRWSDDQGATWSAPVNVSRTCDLYSAMTNWTGTGVPMKYWGDSAKPNVFSHGDNIVVTWVDKYAPEAGWVFGQVGESTIQGTVEYVDGGTLTGKREIPYSAVYAAISNDGGQTWVHGDAFPPLQLTYGRRDAIQDVNRGSGGKWVITWQEDPEGLQRGEGDGPGHGASGAKVTKGTDIWYTFTSDLKADPFALRHNRTPVTDHSEYDVTGLNGYPLAGNAGVLFNHGSSRCNLMLVKDGQTFKACLAYEETKGLPDLEEGKTVQYHSFAFNAPPANGPDTARSGEAGTQLSDLAENSRRVRFVTQPPNGVDPAIAIFWRQGEEAKGAPADVMMRVSTALDGAAVAAAPLLNLSSNTPRANDATMLEATSDNPLENALAHRALLRGAMLVVGWSYTPNGPVARYTDLEHFNFWIRRSVDGGVTWLKPQNISRLKSKKVTVKEPRIVGVPKAGAYDPNAFIVAYGVETNVYEGLEEAMPLDIHVCRTATGGAHFQKTAKLGRKALADYESQLRLNPEGTRVFAVWMEGLAPSNVLFTTGVPVKSASWSPGCATRSDGLVDWTLLVLLAGGLAALTVRLRRIRSRAA